MEDPLGLVLGGGKPTHLAGPPHLVGAQLASLIPDHMRQPGGGVSVEDLRGPVGRAVICDDEEIDAQGSVKPQVVLDDVRFVADLQGHDQPHRGRLS